MERARRAERAWQARAALYSASVGNPLTWLLAVSTMLFVLGVLLAVGQANTALR